MDRSLIYAGTNSKYYHQRYNIFSKYDEGIQINEEAWYSVTPEQIAIHIASRYKNMLHDQHATILDGFCGVGGNLIQFARMSPHVTAIGCDINIEMIRMAKINAKIYGVEKQCQFIQGDFMKIVKTLNRQHIDAIFLSPPWGGEGYLNEEKYSLSMMTPDGFDIMRLCRQHLNNNIGFLMPRNIDFDELKEKLLTHEHPVFEFERNFVGNKTKTITAYFGDLVNESAETDEEEENYDEDEVFNGYSNLVY